MHSFKPGTSFWRETILGNEWKRTKTETVGVFHRFVILRKEREECVIFKRVEGACYGWGEIFCIDFDSITYDHKQL